MPILKAKTKPHSIHHIQSINQAHVQHIQFKKTCTCLWYLLERKVERRVLPSPPPRKKPQNINNHTTHASLNAAKLALRISVWVCMRSKACCSSLGEWFRTISSCVTIPSLLLYSRIMASSNSTFCQIVKWYLLSKYIYIYIYVFGPVLVRLFVLFFRS